MSLRCWKYVLALCAFGSAMWAQSPPSGIAGEWNGTISGKLRMELQIEKADGPGVQGRPREPGSRQRQAPHRRDFI